MTTFGKIFANTVDNATHKGHSSDDDGCLAYLFVDDFEKLPLFDDAVDENIIVRLFGQVSIDSAAHQPRS